MTLQERMNAMKETFERTLSAEKRKHVLVLSFSQFCPELNSLPK